MSLAAWLAEQEGRSDLQATRLLYSVVAHSAHILLRVSSILCMDLLEKARSVAGFMAELGA